MYIKEFEPHLFSIDREEYNTLSVCVSHLNYQNFPNKKIIMNPINNIIINMYLMFKLVL